MSAVYGAAAEEDEICGLGLFHFGLENMVHFVCYLFDFFLAVEPSAVNTGADGGDLLVPYPFVKVFVPKWPCSALDGPYAVNQAFVAGSQRTHIIPELDNRPTFQARTMVSHELFSGNVQMVHEAPDFVFGDINELIVTVCAAAVSAFLAVELESLAVPRFHELLRVVQ